MLIVGVSAITFARVLFDYYYRGSFPFLHHTEFHASNIFRAVDGLLFLIVNTSLMLSAVNLFVIFLNFAALMFLQTIDNVALKVCIDGYWTRSLQECAQDVVDMKIAFKQNYTLNCMRGRTTILWVSAAYVILVGFWAKTHFID